MAHRIVASTGCAQKAGILAGDELVSINGNVILDFIDYQDLCAQRALAVEIRRSGAKHVFHIRKEEYAPLGLEFSSPKMSGMRLCCNKCLFCFVDQLPAHVRSSMRVKDDDWRTSLMMGSYVTLTNVSDREIQRIVRRHASPLYISVHATDEALRCKILGTPRAARLTGQLQALKKGRIDFHCQAVLCPGINDGEVLEKTIADLARLAPAAKSLALVPVGLTEHREGLYPLRPYTREEACAVLDLAETWRARLLPALGTRFVFPSDEFYLLAGREIPSDEEYEEYGQIDDGVGMLRLLETEFSQAYAELPDALKARSGAGRKLAIACGKSPAGFLQKLLDAHPIAGADVQVYPLENRFFGRTVTVSGLITGGDLVEQMRGVDCDAILITGCMLRSDGDRFLDDMRLDQARALLGKPLIPVGRRGDELLDAILQNLPAKQ